MISSEDVSGGIWCGLPELLCCCRSRRWNRDSSERIQRPMYTVSQTLLLLYTDYSPFFRDCVYFSLCCKIDVTTHSHNDSKIKKRGAWTRHVFFHYVISFYVNINVKLVHTCSLSPCLDWQLILWRSIFHARLVWYLGVSSIYNLILMRECTDERTVSRMLQRGSRCCFCRDVTPAAAGTF